MVTYYRCIVKHEFMYTQTLGGLAESTAEDKMKHCWRLYDTCLNKHLKRRVATYAPKYKYFYGLISLETRVCITIGIHTVRHHAF